MKIETMKQWYLGILLFAVVVAYQPTVLQAAEADRSLLSRIELLENQLKAMKDELATTSKSAKQAKTDAATAKKEARAADEVLDKFKITGYAAAEFTATDAGDVNSTFGGVKFNPILLFKHDNVFFEGEVEFELEDDGSTSTNLEFANIGYFLHDALNVSAGKFLSPIGQFQERLHPAWINKLVDRPPGFKGKGGGIPLSEVGLMARGGVAVAPWLVNYSAFVGNGPQVNLTSGALDRLELDGFGDDDNDNKAVGGRIGVLPLPSVEIGGSVLYSKVKGKKDAGVAGSLSEGDFLLWSIDAAYTQGGTDLRFEYFSSQLDSFLSQAAASGPTTTIPKTEWEGWYAQASYHLSGITNMPFVQNLEPVIRYGSFDVDGFSGFVTSGAPEERLSIGLNYVITPSAILKTELSWREFRESTAEDATEFRAQMTYGF